MRLLLAVAALVALTQALPLSETEFRARQLVDHINGLKGNTWKAELHPRFSKMNLEQLRGLMGARKRHENPRSHLFKLHQKFDGDRNDIPDEFDARTYWPKCTDVISIIADQSACGSCWAVSAASVMSDRVCIGSDGGIKTPISANDIMSCCSECGNGCEGGWPDETFYTWHSNGVVTGSNYSTDQGCVPYPFPECEHHTNASTFPACPSTLYDTPTCQKLCQTSYTTHTYSEDKTYGMEPMYLSGDVTAIQNEILKNGPVVFTYDVYEDFLLYKSGVYQHTTGSYLGGHAVRAIGWGTEDGTDYWLIANSWNQDWGDSGLFKIIRDMDECGIEKEVSSAKYKTN